MDRKTISKKNNKNRSQIAAKEQKIVFQFTSKLE